MDADVDAAWICTQAVVSTDSQSENEQEKMNNYGCIVLNGMIDNGRYILKEGDNTIGRHPLNHIYIEHPSVSMNHAVIQCDSDGVVLLDKGSLNKTKLNKKTLRKDVAYFLEENALLMFGEVQADYFMNEESNEFINDTKSLVPENTSEHKATQNDGISLSKLSNAVNTPKSFRTDISNANTDCNVSLVIENSSACKIEKEVSKTISKTECTMNNLNDIHTKLNSSSPSDEYLLEALSQVETKQNNVNSKAIFQNLSNEDTFITNLTESVSKITREDTPSPVMDLESSILTTNNITKNQFQSPNKVNTEAIREDTPSPVMDLESSILTTNSITKNQFQSPNKINTEAIREDTPSPVMDLESSILTANNMPKILFQSPTKINKELIREDTPSPIMDFGCFNNFENNLETNNHSTIAAIQSPNEVDKFNNTQVLEIDNNVVKLYTHTSNNSNILFCEDQKVESGEQSIIPIKNSSDIHSNDNLSGSNNINLSTNGHNTVKHKIIVNTFEADDDDVFRNFIEKESKSQQHDLAILENQDFFNFPTQKVSIKKNINLKSKVTSSINDEDTQKSPEFKQLNKTNIITSKNYSTNEHEDLTQIPEIDDDFFNCPTQKVSITKNLRPKITSSINDKETQFSLEFKQFNKTNTISSKNYSTNKHEENTQIPEIDDNFFNCPTQKLSITKKINPKPKISSSMHKEETQELLEFAKPCKSNSTTMCEENIQIPKIDDDFFNCPTQKLSSSKNMFPKPKVSPSIHEEETQKPPGFSQFDKTNNIASNTCSTNIRKDLTEVAEIDDDFFNCPTQKVSTSKKIIPKPKISSSIHEEETQKPPEFTQFDKTKHIASNTCSTNIRKDLTEVAEIDDDFFNCPTQKVSTSKKIIPKPKISSSIHEEETQKPPGFSQFDKTNNIASNTCSTNIRKDLTEVAEIDDDFFNCPTQKVSTTKKIIPTPKESSSIHEVETQGLLEFSKPCKSDSTSMCEENIQIPKIDDDFFNCPTQKLSSSKNMFPKPKVSPSIHEEETQKPPRFSQFDKTNNIASNTCSTNIRKDLTEVAEIDDDFFNCPTQKVSTSKKINPKPKVSPSIHEEETQRPMEFSQFDKTKHIASNTCSTNIRKDLTEVAEIDDDFFNCPTQKVSTSKKIIPKPKISSSIHEEETQKPPEFTQFDKTKHIASNTCSTNIRKDLTEVAEIDDDFFNCPTQKVSTSKKIIPKPKISSSIHEEETQKPPEFTQFDKTNNIASNTSSTNICKDLTEVPEMDDDFFNCPTQKVSFTKRINSKLKVSSAVQEEETQELLKLHKPIKNIPSSSKSYTISKPEDLTQIPEMEDDFFNCPTQKISSNSNSKFSMDCKKRKSIPKIINEAVTNDSSIQSISKISLHSNIKQDKGNIVNSTSQKVLTKFQSNSISNCSININEDVTKNPEHFDESNSHKQTVVPDNENKSKAQKSKFVKSNTISLSNVQLEVMCNEKSSNSLRTNKPTIRVREDLLMSNAVDSSNNSMIILNKHNKNTVFNNINTTVPFNKIFDSPGCSKTTTIKKNDLNAISSIKQEHFIDDSDQSQVSISLKYNHHMKQMDESIFSPLNIPDVSANSLLEHHSSPITIENNLNTLKCEPSTYSNSAFEWKSFWNKKKVQSQDKEKSDKQKSIKIAPEIKENKERYQTRAITRKRKQNGIIESNKKLCNRNRILEPLVENSSEIVVSFSYLKSRKLQEMKQFVEKTGGTVTDEITQCSVLVTDKIRCTMKILSAIARGCPIVNVNWLKHSYTVKMFQDVDDFIIADKDAERKYKFLLKESLAKAKTKRLLDGYNVLVTPSVKPSPQEMKVIITCAGGNFVLNWATTQYTKELIVTCDKDRTRWKPAWDNDLAKIIDSDTLVRSIIRQQLLTL